MIEVHGAQARLRGARPGAWLISRFTGWRWAVWPDREVGSMLPRWNCPPASASKRATMFSERAAAASPMLARRVSLSHGYEPMTLDSRSRTRSEGFLISENRRIGDCRSRMMDAFALIMGGY